MIRLLPSLAAAIAACTPSPQETAMPSPSHNPETGGERGGDMGSGSAASGDLAQASGGSAAPQNRAAPGPVPEPVSAAENPLPAGPGDTPAEAEGRRTLSTAFVRVGPDGRLTVELRNGRVLVLRNVAMRRKDYCGEQLLGGKTGAHYCGNYAEVAAARPGGPPAPAEPDLAAPNRLES